VRAARVLDLLLILQRRGQLTAKELATALEVSERTILRDVEALSEAGVPIYTVRGGGGGISLMDGFETRLTGLTVDEARCLLLVGQPDVAHRLGLDAPTRSVRNKLIGTLSPELADLAEGLADWFVNDPDPWAGHRVPHGELRRIARCIHDRCRVELSLGHDEPVTAEPLGLVLKAGSWHLVCATDPRVVCLDELRGTRITAQRFDPPPGFSLDEFWARHLQDQGAGRR
jgi:predicted DNA-binding transcriptional regulator YafY